MLDVEPARLGDRTGVVLRLLLLLLLALRRCCCCDGDCDGAGVDSTPLPLSPSSSAAADALTSRAAPACDCGFRDAWKAASPTPYPGDVAAGDASLARTGFGT
jgi:hypothetical protein